MTQPRVAMSAEELSCEWIPLQAGLWPRGQLQWHGRLGGLPHVRDVRRDRPVGESSNRLDAVTFSARGDLEPCRKRVV